MKKLLIWLAVCLGAGLAFGIDATARADPPIYGVQASACGTPGNTPVTGQPYPINIFNGQVCINGTITVSSLALSAGTALIGSVATTVVPPGDTPLRNYNSTTAGTATTLFAAAGAGVKNYVTGLQCSNSSVTAQTVALSDVGQVNPTTIYLGSGMASNITFNPPLVTAANTAFTFTASTGVTTIACSGQGYTGP